MAGNLKSQTVMSSRRGRRPSSSRLPSNTESRSAKRIDSNVATSSYNDLMKTVGIRTLKNRLSEYVRVVQSGERVTVTSRGAPVIDLIPHAPHGLEPEDELLRLARAGKVRLGSRASRVRYTRPPKDRQLPDEVVEALLNEVRGDR